LDGEFLELIPAGNIDNKIKQNIAKPPEEKAENTQVTRQIYKVERSVETNAPEITLKRVRLTTAGVYEIGESYMPLSLIDAP
jgi:hypothetical protein